MRVLLFAMVFAAIAASGRAVPITICGDSVPDGETGELMNDLACTDLASIAVAVGRGATLDLNGFRITGPGSTHGLSTGISCGGSTSARAITCQVNGPGEVTAFGTGLYAHDIRRVVVTGLTLRGNNDGILAFARRLSLTNVVADANDDMGVAGFKIQGTGIETNDNGRGGLGGTGVNVSGLTATGNGDLGGVFSFEGRGGRAVLTDSTVTGNDALGQGYDIVRVGSVRLVNTVCGKSVRLRGVLHEVIGSYGCAND